MAYSILSWIGDESLFRELLQGFATPLLLFLVVVCIAVLSQGAHWMIDGVVDLAHRTGLPRIVIGATIVSLGTTMPEAFVSVMAAFMGDPGLALGNGVGSIIADTGLIFGLTCLLTRVPANRFILNRTGWVQVGSATLLVLLALAARWGDDAEPVLERWVGVLFIGLLAGYLYLAYAWARSEGASEATAEGGLARRSVVMSLLLIVAGVFLVVLAARILVPAAAEVAMRFGVPNDVIAATMVAFGTSLPELITAIVAVRKGHPEIAVGNVVGADVLNCLFVIGAAACASPLAVPPNFYILHFPAMLFILYAFRAFIFMARDGHFRRWQGGFLVLVYVVYVTLQYTTGGGAPH